MVSLATAGAPCFAQRVTFVDGCDMVSIIEVELPPSAPEWLCSRILSGESPRYFFFRLKQDASMRFRFFPS